MKSKPTALDKAIARLSPQKALNRELARRKLEYLNSGYSHHGANTNRNSVRDWDSESNSPDEDINLNLPPCVVVQGIYTWAARISRRGQSKQ